MIVYIWPEQSTTLLHSDSLCPTFKSLMKAKGLLGGKYAPVAVKDGLETKASIFEEDTLGDHNGNNIAEMDKVVKRK